MAFILLGFGGLLFSCADGNHAPTHGKVSSDAGENLPYNNKEERTPCRVLTIYDGDTLGCDLNGDGRLRKPEEEIRLLGIDSPEMHYSRKNRTHRSAHPVDEPFAKEASRWLAERTASRTVYLAFDARPTDRYGRVLAYVYADPRAPVSLNEEALRLGYATTLFLGKNRRLEDQFTRAETEARHAGRGVWGPHPGH